MLGCVFLRTGDEGCGEDVSFVSGAESASFFHFYPWAEVVLLFIVDLIVEVFVEGVVEIVVDQFDLESFLVLSGFELVILVSVGGIRGDIIL